MITNPVHYSIIIAVVTSQALAYNICNNTYTNGIGIQCFPCEPGYIAIEDCPGNYTSTKCEQCEDGTYQPECVTYNITIRCRNCTVCDVYKVNCTIYKDAVCDLNNGDSSDNSGRHSVDGNDLAPQANKEGRHIAVVRPQIESNSNDCKEVENTDDILQHRTREGFQVAGDSENTQAVNAAENSENKHQNNQLCQRTKNESLSPRDLVAPELEIDWTSIFLQLSRSFPPTRWKLFAIQLLSNCQVLNRSVNDTVDEIELEAKNQHTEGLIIHAYIKVFNKWLDNVGRTNAHFEHIKHAVSTTIEAKEASDLVLSIERNPPMKEKKQRNAALVPSKFEPTFRSNTSLQQFMALHNDEEPGNSNCGRELYVRSSETTRFQLAHCPYCSLYTRNEISDRHETLTSVQSNESYREQNKKRKKDQSQTQQSKRSITEKYIIENAKQNLHLDIMPIRQNDYDMFMNFVIELIANECQVAESTVWSVTLAGFCEAHEVNNKEKETLFVINCERINLCLIKETFEELTFYGNIARPKLLKYLKERNPEYDSTTSETFMFINFNGTPLFERWEDKDDQNESNSTTKEKDTKQRSKVKSSTGSSIKVRPYMKESEENIDEYKPRRQQNSSDQPSESEQINRCFSKTSTFDTKENEPIEEERASKSASNHEKEISNKAEDEQVIVKSQMNDIKKKEIESLEVDMETETESITGWLSHKFCEIS